MNNIELADLLKDITDKLTRITDVIPNTNVFTKDNGEILSSIRDRTIYKELEHVRLLISKSNNDIQTLCEYVKNEILEGHNLNLKAIDNSFKEIDATLDKIKESKKIINELYDVDYDLKMFKE